MGTDRRLRGWDQKSAGRDVTAGHGPFRGRVSACSEEELWYEDDEGAGAAEMGWDCCWPGGWNDVCGLGAGAKSGARAQSRRYRGQDDGSGQFVELAE